MQDLISASDRIVSKIKNLEDHFHKLSTHHFDLIQEYLCLLDDQNLIKLFQQELQALYCEQILEHHQLALLNMIQEQIELRNYNVELFYKPQKNQYAEISKRASIKA